MAYCLVFCIGSCSPLHEEQNRLICIVFNDNIVGKMRKGLNSACFVKVNLSVLSKSYEKTSSELTFGRSEMTLSWGETDLDRIGPGAKRP